MFKFYIRVFGCPMRGIEAERIRNYFIANGGKASSREKADVIIIFGCSIVETTNATTMEYIRKVDNTGQRIIVSGCSPVISKDEIQGFFDGELLVSRELDNIDKLFPDFKIKYQDIPLPTVSHKDLVYNEFYLEQYRHYTKNSLFRTKSTPQLMITSKGCPNACTYCTVRMAMGKLSSYPMEAIETTYKDAIRRKQQVFIFNGDDTGAYGIDINSGFDELLLKLEEATPKDQYVKWAIDNLHPRWVLKYKDSFLELIKKGRIIDMVVPLQAASETMLKAMRRHYKVSDILPVLKEFQDANPDLKLTTHFMFGFPGETDEDIQEIQTVIDQDCFKHFVLLRYFESPKADSAVLQPKVSKSKVQGDMKMIETYIQEKGYICQMTDYFDD